MLFVKFVTSNFMVAIEQDHFFNINFYNLHAALLKAAKEYEDYIESEKPTNVVAKVVHAFRTFLFPKPQSKDVELAANIRQIVPFLDPGPENAHIEPRDTTQDQRMLLVVAQALLRSASWQLLKFTSRNLIELYANADSTITSFGRKAFDQSSHYARELSKMSIFRPTIFDRICAASHLLRENAKQIESLYSTNDEAVDTLLTQPARSSITRAPLALISVRKFRKSDTKLAATPIDLVKVMAKQISKDMKSQVMQQLIDATYSGLHKPQEVQAYENRQG